MGLRFGHVPGAGWRLRRWYFEDGGIGSVEDVGLCNDTTLSSGYYGRVESPFLGQELRRGKKRSRNYSLVYSHTVPNAKKIFFFCFQQK